MRSFIAKCGRHFGLQDDAVRKQLLENVGTGKGASDSEYIMRNCSVREVTAAEYLRWKRTSNVLKSGREVHRELATYFASGNERGSHEYDHSCLYALQDTGNPDALAGEKWTEDYTSLLREAGYDEPVITPNSEPMAFGDAEPTLPVGDVVIPLFYHREGGTVNVLIKTIRIVRHAVGLLDGLRDMMAVRTSFLLEETPVMNQLHKRMLMPWPRKTCLTSWSRKPKPKLNAQA
jgi:hypothetical protein